VNGRDARDLLDLIERFIDGANKSPQLAAEIEGLVIECCQDEDWFDEISEALALFVPGGGGHYIDEGGLASELAVIVALLRDAAEVLPRYELDPPDPASEDDQCG
jgi:hypothetical protein